MANDQAYAEFSQHDTSRNDAPRVTYIEVPEGHEERRLDNFLLSRIKGVPKSHIYAIIRSGEVRINSKRSKASSRIDAGDRIRIPPIRTAHRSRSEPQRELVDLIEQSIIYEDDDIIAINKPRWVGAHSGVNRPYGVIEIFHYLSNSKDLYLVHRLDLETTGVLLIARNLNILRKINSVWHKQDSTHKIYAAVVQGLWKQGKQDDTRSISHIYKEKVGGEFIMKTAKSPMDKSEHQPAHAPRREEAGEDEKRARKAITLFKLLEHKDDYSLMEAEILTGRTHQIRSQAAEEGHPIVGDKKYAFLATNIRQKDELALHCLRIEFTLDDRVYEFMAPTPEVFDKYGFQLA